MKKFNKSEIISNILIICMLIVLLSVSFSGSGLSVSETYAPIYRGATNDKKISLMINVYWGTEYVRPMAELLMKYGFRTTFFLGGMWASKNTELVRWLYDNGFEIGNHGYNHKDHSKLSYEENKKEIIITENLIKSICGTSSYLFAPPSGYVGDNMYKVLEEYGLSTILWTRDTIDWRDKSADIVYDRVLKDLNNGDLILMHPTEHTLSALPRILEKLISLGYSVNKVSDIL